MELTEGQKTKIRNRIQQAIAHGPTAVKKFKESSGFTDTSSEILFFIDVIANGTGVPFAEIYGDGIFGEFIKELRREFLPLDEGFYWGDFPVE